MEESNMTWKYDTLHSMGYIALLENKYEIHADDFLETFINQLTDLEFRLVLINAHIETKTLTDKVCINLWKGSAGKWYDIISKILVNTLLRGDKDFDENKRSLVRKILTMCDNDALVVVPPSDEVQQYAESVNYPIEKYLPTFANKNQYCHSIYEPSLIRTIVNECVDMVTDVWDKTLLEIIIYPRNISQETEQEIFVFGPGSEEGYPRTHTTGLTNMGNISLLLDTMRSHKNLVYPKELISKLMKMCIYDKDSICATREMIECYGGDIMDVINALYSIPYPREPRDVCSDDFILDLGIMYMCTNNNAFTTRNNEEERDSFDIHTRSMYQESILSMYNDYIIHPKDGYRLFARMLKIGNTIVVNRMKERLFIETYDRSHIEKFITTFAQLNEYIIGIIEELESDSSNADIVCDIAKCSDVWECLVIWVHYIGGELPPIKSVVADIPLKLFDYSEDYGNTLLKYQRELYKLHMLLNNEL